VSEQLVSLREILQGLHDHEVDYVLFGATAMLFYGVVRNTEDVDIVVANSEANLRRVHDWLVSVDAHLMLSPERRFGPRERWAMFRGENATVITSCGQIDVVQQIEGMPSFERLSSDSEVFEREGMRVKVMSRETLVELKRRRGSPQDLADIEAIALLDRLEE
jgi:predicted nucleotidyltransferase